MVEYKCPKCGKTYKKKGKYYEEHVKNCSGTEIVSKSKSKGSSSKVTRATEQDVNILSRLEKIEHRLENLEYDFKQLTRNQTNKRFINDENSLLEIAKEKIRELSKKSLGTRVIILKDLYDSISRDYIISIENFSKFLIRLYDADKIQLESATIDNNFSINDNYGNVFKIIRIFE